MDAFGKVVEFDDASSTGTAREGYRLSTDDIWKDQRRLTGGTQVELHLQRLFSTPNPQAVEVGSFLKTIWHLPAPNPSKFMTKHSVNLFARYAEIY